MRIARFGVLALVAYLAAGPILVFLAGSIGAREIPVWLFGVVASTLLVLATAASLVLDGHPIEAPARSLVRRRIFELAGGFLLGVGLFAVLALVRAASVGANWTFGGLASFAGVAAGLGVSLVLLLPEELVFRGYALRRASRALGPVPAVVLSSAFFGLYHVLGTGMWGMGAFFAFAMPALGGLLFGSAAVRTGGLALPVGLHLGGNWVQANVLSIHAAQGTGVPDALWTAYVSGSQLEALISPDVPAHLPYMAVIALAAASVSLALKPRTRPV